ncbi:MAG: HD domain-containing phosphohydrolase [Pseudomonadota bacterium]
MNKSSTENTPLKTHEEELAVNDLQPGMFVSRLDRPWTDTPFMLQGFLLENPEALEALKQYCRWVYIDRSRSTGVHFREAPAPIRAPEPLPMTPIKKEEPIPAGPSFFNRLKAFFGFGEEEDINHHKSHQAPEIFKEELNQAVELIISTQSVVENVLDDIRNAEVPNMRQVQLVVNEMIQSVSRNPNAIIWASRLKQQHNYTYEQLISVSIQLVNFGRFLGLNTYELQCLGLAGFVQDFGMARIPAEIVHKKTKLTPKEREIMQEHVRFTVEILQADGSIPNEVIEIAHKHHERIDGSGYPRGLSGGLIGVHAEMSGLVDTFCAMTHNRPYRISQVENHKALNELYSQRGKLFSETLVEQFVQCIGIYPPGTIVELNSNEIGIVIQQHAVRRLQPQIMIVMDTQRVPYRAPIMLDLLTNPYIDEKTPYCILRTHPEGSFGINPRDFYL